MDPSIKYLSRSIDSYLAKKKLAEFKILLARITDIKPIFQALKTEDIGLRLKIKMGDCFWTSTDIVKPKKDKKGYYCEIRQLIRLRYDPVNCPNAELIMVAFSNESQKLPKVFQPLKHEVIIGTSTIALDKFSKDKEYVWTILNNDKNYANFMVYRDGARLSLSYKILDNLPGNYPETLMEGKCFSIGEMVICNEQVELDYPSTKLEFDLLQRKDIQFESSRVGTSGCPLRVPMSEEEWKISGLNSI